ncbi:Sodium/hydrogen exchanger family-domain-containing protein [Suillus clintonianus]|uniref:Sodium/hydrogen exchanger family-domain-containing protein n=1 Tax=Suillus clintonianus TaxID=1904413 RepID=UPI001B867E88|nr:Sodium/hydrogen exchanger family-domain-containing protein [Suillus clintonianus]KAG2123796.1 Sodium/hydrogen exchanger family-domain-containing protein [Suillus clintonianus]
MLFRPLSLTIPHIAYACLGGFVVVFGMFSLFIREKLYIGEACWAFLFGVIIGPYGAGIFDPRSWGDNTTEDTVNEITLEFTRVVLAIGVFAIGVELPKAYMKRHWKSLLYLLFPVMTWGWFVSAGLIYALIPDLTFLSSLAVAACLTPTDPILAAAVVGGKYADKHVPAHLRHLLAAESGCNDGAAYPFLYIALYLILDSSTGRAVEDWFLLLWLYQVILGVAVGALIGWGFRHLMKFCQRNDFVDRQSYVAQYISLALLTIGIMTILGSDDLLAAFSCGTAFAWDGFFNRQTEESVFSSVIDLLFNVAAFVYVGAWMPFDSFSNETLSLSVWRLVVIAVLVLMLKRLPIMIGLYKFIPDVKTFREAIFSGHFGPIGIGAIYISTLAAQTLPKPNNPPANQTEFLALTIQPIVAFMVLCSVAIHGLSIPFSLLGRRVHSVGSRTWSRHATPAVPDWATHTRHVTRAEDVIINRDPAGLERGEGGLTEEEKSALESKRASTITASPLSPDEIEEIGEASSAETRAEAVLEKAEEDTKEETPPDGRDTTAEWREGPHKIIERRGGPGEEVDVEVIYNAFKPSERGVHSRFSAREGGALQAGRAYLRRLHHAPEEIHRGAEHVEENVKHDIHALELKAQEVLHAGGSSDENTGASPEGDEDEEGWASDKSGDGEGPVYSFGELPGDHRKRPRSWKTKSGTHPAAARSSRSHRRRQSTGDSVTFSSHARQLLEQDPPSALTAEPSEIVPLEDEDQRGRSHAPHRQGSGHTYRRSIQHRRLESLKTSEHNSRDVSPARSVRFVDEEPRSSTPTPKTTLDQTPQGSSSEPSTTDDSESRGKVTFGLTHVRRGSED